MLKQLADRLDEHHAFAKGQFVVWKAGSETGSSRTMANPAS